MSEWVSTNRAMPPVHITECGETISDTVVFRCEIDKTVHLGNMEKVWVDKRGEFSYPLYYWYDQWGDRWENVSHWMPLPEAPHDE